MYKVTIDKAENGFIVKAGCKRFVFQTYKKLERELKKYLEDPEGYIKKHKYGAGLCGEPVVDTLPEGTITISGDGGIYADSTDGNDVTISTDSNIDCATETTSG